jgi:uncharacterized protein YukE
MSLLITIGGSLIGKLYELIQTKKELIEIDEKQVAVDALRAKSLSSVSSVAGEQAQQGTALSRVNADMVASFHLLANEQSEYEKNTKRLIEVVGALATKQHIEVVPNSIFVRKSTADLNEETATLNATLGEQEKAMQPAIESLRVIKSLYGLTTDQLLAYAEQTGSSTGQLEFFRKQIDSDLPALRALANEIASNTNKMADMERQAILTGLAVQQIKPPKLDLDFLRSLSQDPNARIGAAVQSAMGGFTQGPPSVEQLFGAIRPELEGVRKEFRENAAALASNQAEAKALYNTYVGQLDPMYQQWMQRLDAADQNMKAFTDHTKQAESAARALANTTSTLQKELEQAKAAASANDTGSLDARREQEEAAYQDRLRDLARNNQATRQNLDIALSIHKYHLAQIGSDTAKAYEAITNRVAEILATGEINDYDRHKALIQKQVNDDIAFMRQLGVDKTTINIRTGQLREAHEAQFFRWFIEESEKVNKQLLSDGIAYDKAVTEQRLAQSEAWFKGQLQQAEIYNKQIEALQQRFGKKQGGHAVTLDMRDLDDVNTRLEVLGATVESVDQHFGSGSKNLAQFSLRLRAIELIAQGHPFKALAIEAQQLSEQMRNSQTDAERWASFLTNAVNQMGSNIESGFEGLVNGTATFAQVMKKIIFDLIASMAEQWGSYYLALGIADLFWNPAKGAAELAAGAALMALAGVLHALGGSHQQSTAASASAGAGASRSGAANATTATPDRQREPRTTIVPFPTSAARTVIVNQVLNEGETRNWLESTFNGHMKKSGTLTRGNIQNLHKDIVRKVVKEV